MEYSWFYWFNENLAIVVSLLLNSSLIYFIFSEKANALKSYRKMILLNCFAEFLLAMTTILLRPRLLLTNNALIVIVTSGFLQNLSQFWINILGAVFTCAGATDCIKLMVEFLYRYLIVCRGYELSVGRLLLLAIGIYLCAFANSYIFYLTLSPDPNIEWNSLLARIHDFNVNEDIGRFIVSDTRSYGGIALGVLGFSTAIFVYLIIFVCSKRILAALRQQRAFMSNRTLKMNQGLNLMLFAQACVPIFGSVLPVTIILSSVLFGRGSTILSFVLSFLIPWSSAAGPTITLVCVPSYRRRLFGILRGQFMIKNSISSAHLASTSFRQNNKHIP